MLYRLPELLKTSRFDREIIIAEGERKVDLLRGWGFTATYKGLRFLCQTFKGEKMPKRRVSAAYCEAAKKYFGEFARFE